MVVWSWLVAMGNWVIERWRHHLVRLSFTPGLRGMADLRAWQRRAAQTPTLVFPEGQLGIQFGDVREGAGRLLSALGPVTVPVGCGLRRAGGT